MVPECVPVWLAAAALGEYIDQYSLYTYLIDMHCRPYSDMQRVNPTLYTILLLPIQYTVWCIIIAYTRTEGEPYTVQAPGWATQVGGENERMVNS